MGNAGVAADICAQGDQGVELLPFAIVQAEHVVQKPRMQQRRELQNISRPLQCMHCHGMYMGIPY